MSKSLRILIVEESLVDKNGHWFEYIKTIASAAKACGIQVDVACHINVCPTIGSELNLFPIFKHSRYRESNSKRLLGQRYYGWLLHNYRTWRAIRNFLVRNEPYNHVFVPTVLVHHLLAWWLILKNKRISPQKLTLLFLTNPGVWNQDTHTTHYPRSAKVLGFLLKRFSSEVYSQHVQLAVETQGAKHEFQTVCGLPFSVLSQPVPMADSPISPELTPSKIVLASFGFARYEKGSDLLKSAIIKCQEKNFFQDAIFRLQWIDSFKLPDGSLCDIGTEFAKNSSIDIINRTISLTEYRQLLEKTSIMILPYRNSSYHARSSRVAIEALCCGIPIIYTRHGWLEESVEKYGAGIAMKAETSDALVCAIEEAIQNYQSIKSQSVAMAGAARQYFSAKKFIKTLFVKSKTVSGSHS